MTSSPRLLPAAALSLLAGAGCTTVLYDGPRRPSSEVALIKSRDTSVVRFDKKDLKGKTAGKAARLEVLPGEHELGINLIRETPGLAVTHIQTSRATRLVCLDLQAGHTYRTQPLILRDRWTPEVIDVDLGKPLDASCDADDDDSARRPSAPWPRSSRGANDARVGTGPALFVGVGVGGDDAIKKSAGGLGAGTGGMVGVSGLLTPYWPSEGVGLGLGLDVAFKYAVFTDGANADVWRFPVTLAAHVLAGSDPHFFLLRAGVTKDFAVTYSDEGSSDRHPTGTFGPFAGIGYLGRSSDAYSVDLLAYVSLTHHRLDGESLSANTFGFMAGVHYNL